MPCRSLLAGALMFCGQFAGAAYNSSNFLIFKTTPGTYTGADSTNYAPTGLPGWGTTPPAVGATVSWPSQFGGGVQRRADHTQLTGDYNGTAAPESLIVYSRYTPVNTTGDLVLVHGDNSTSCWVFNTHTNAPAGGPGAPPLRLKPSLGTGGRALGEVNELRWDYSGAHPFRLYFVGRSLPNSNALGSENVGTSFYFVDIDSVTGAQSLPTLIHDFSAEFPAAGSYPTGGYAGAVIMNDVEGDSSYDSRYWAWQVMNDSLGSGSQPYAVIVYDKTNNAILGRLQRNCAGVAAPCTTVNTPATASPYLTRPNMVEMSPKATRVIVDWDRAYTGHFDGDMGGTSDAPHAFLKDFSDPIVIGADSTHSGWAWGQNGEEMFVSQNDRNDFIEAVDVASSATAKCSATFNNPAYSWSCGMKIAYYQSFDPTYDGISIHFGRIYDPNKKGWAYMDVGDSVDGWGKNKVFLVELKDVTGSDVPRVWRIAPAPNVHRSTDYRSEGSAALNYSATEVWTSGNWAQNLDSVSEVYSMGMPSDWHSVLSGSIPTPASPRSLRLK